MCFFMNRAPRPMNPRPMMVTRDPAMIETVKAMTIPRMIVYIPRISMKATERMRNAAMNMMSQRASNMKMIAIPEGSFKFMMFDIPNGG